MRSRMLQIVLASTCLILVACGGSKEMAKMDSESPCPDWFGSPPEDPEYLYSPATSTSRDLQMAINKAKQQARTDIGAQMETRMRGLIKQFQEEIGEGEESQMSAQFTQVSETIVSTTLNGCKAKYQTTNREGVLWRACVLMEYPIGEANAKFLQALQQREILRQRAAATDAFKELEEKVEKYEQEKKMSQKEK